MLLDAGADPGIADDSWYGSLAHLAAKERDPDIIARIHRAGAAVDLDSPKFGGTPLHAAAYEGNTGVAMLLLDLGARVEATGELDRTPLHLAAYGGHVETVRGLLARGADREVTDGLGRTAAHLAAEAGHADVLDVLRWQELDGRRSPSVDRPDAYGWTPRHAAAAFGRSECLSVLRGPFQVRSEGGWTPLRLALSGRHLDCVELMLGFLEADGGELELHPDDLLRAGVPARLAARLGVEPPPRRYGLDPRDLLAAEAGLPAIVLVRIAGYTIRPRDGVELAAWPDGLVLFASDPADPEAGMLVGRIEPDAIERMLDECTELGLLDLPDWDEVGMHASSRRLVLRRDGKHRGHTWDEERSMRYSWRLDSLHPTYTNAWTRAVRAVESLVPEEAMPLDEVPGGELRGCRAGARPGQIPWTR